MKRVSLKCCFLKGKVTTLAGGKKGNKDGVGKEATFYHPTGLAYDSQTGTLYVADHVSNDVRYLADHLGSDVIYFLDFKFYSILFCFSSFFVNYHNSSRKLKSSFP